MKQTNLVLVIVDALRVDMVSLHGPDAPPTPSIDALGRRGVVFPNAYSCTNATDSSLTSIMTGLYPRHHGILRHGAKVCWEERARMHDVPQLAEVLKEVGYTTLAIDWLGRWHRRGFDTYTGITRRRVLSKGLIDFVSRHNLWGVVNQVRSLSAGRLTSVANGVRACEDAETVVNEAIRLLRENRSSQPTFLFLHFWDLHAPYRPVARFMPGEVNLSDGQRLTIAEAVAGLKHPDWRMQIEYWAAGRKYVDEFVAAYRAQVRFVDEQLGRLWAAMDRLGLTDNSVVILTSDHGESFCEHGICFDHHGLYETTVHVPLVLSAPGLLPEGIKIPGLVQHTDLMPTIVGLLNVPCARDWDGMSLVPVIAEGISRKPAVYLEEALTQHKIAVRTTSHKYIRALTAKDAVCRYCGIVHGGQEELYDLLHDPLETQSLVDTEPGLRGELLAMLSQWRLQGTVGREAFDELDGGLLSADGPSESQKDADEAIDRLRGLGYL